MKEQSISSKTNINNPESNKELEKVEKQISAQMEVLKDQKHIHLDSAKSDGSEPQTKLSSKEIDYSKEIRLKPRRKIGPYQKDVFNEKFRSSYEFATDYVQFIAENKEVIGENLVIWTKPFSGMPAEEWNVPTNKPVWGPRHLAEQIKKCQYRRLKSEEHKITGIDGMGTYTGSIVVDHVVQRLDAIPVSNNKSIFMGGKNF